MKANKRVESIMKDKVLINDYRELSEDKFGIKKVTYKGNGIFDCYNLSIELNSNKLSMGCSFVDYDEYDFPRNRRIKLDKKAALYLIKDLIKYIFTGRV